MRKAMFATLAAIGLLSAAPTQAKIVHVVSFKYHPGVPAEVKDDIVRRFVALKDEARRDGRPYIVSITGGSPISKEGYDRGFDAAFVVTFENAGDRDYFVGPPYRDAMDPDHLALAQIVHPLIEKDAQGNLSGVFVFDYDDEALKAAP